MQKPERFAGYDVSKWCVADENDDCDGDIVSDVAR